MTTYIIRRLFQLIPVLFGVTLLVFLLMHLTPGNPAQLIAGETASQSTIERIEVSMGLDDPLPVQYVNFVTDVAQLDFGYSYRNNTPVFDGNQT